MTVINLYKKCSNHGCSRPGVEHTGMCYECHKDGIDRRTKINYAKVHRRIAEYLEENWSKGKITRLDTED